MSQADIDQMASAEAFAVDGPEMLDDDDDNCGKDNRKFAGGVVANSELDPECDLGEKPATRSIGGLLVVSTLDGRPGTFDRLLGPDSPSPPSEGSCQVVCTLSFCELLRCVVGFS
jgi:hypothetical protein